MPLAYWGLGCAAPSAASSRSSSESSALWSRTVKCGRRPVGSNSNWPSASRPTVGMWTARKLVNRRRSRSSSGMSRTAKTDMPKSGRPSSAQARVVRSAWRRSLPTVSGPPRTRSVTAAGASSFRNRVRCSIRSPGPRTGLVSPPRTVLLPAGSDWLLVQAREYQRRKTHSR
jgi:hypothetical protein